MPFTTPLALAALASIIPLIILYLLHPKPLEIHLPSLMFLMKVQEEKKRFYSSITRLIKDPLFLTQLLVLIFLSIAAAGPFFTAEEPLSGEHTVIIIDFAFSAGRLAVCNYERTLLIALIQETVLRYF